MTDLTFYSIKYFFTLIAVSLMSVSISQASLMLRITDTPQAGSPTIVTATDQIAGGVGNVAPDNSSIPGLLSASFGTPNFFLTASLGTSKPYPPNSEILADLFLRQLSISSTNGGTLTIEISDNDFTLNGIGNEGFFTADIAGTLGADPLNSVEVDYFYNTSNIPFDTDGATMVGSSAISGGLGFDESFGRVAVSGIDQPFSITQVIKIHMQPNYQILSFDSDLRVVPEPSTALLAGLALFILVIVVSRRRSAIQVW
ncbi:PEP-CTERM sorting domain-containing protein [Nitrosomonas marina]|uniref:PEP-CTERM protein-sorting domain-containing protein n=1 Tax=Nitrosomonas marina TaxID=917 RepID=A0A1H8B0U7_9PROT|nr:PEP-CTERM sorting domain-containing protein [Nitrosomonas marina]SEM76592.1 PEP-CTERM protein-sorting domain-containing protein [Nitrosomonas marina]